ncbi:uncharacterized protein LOC127870016 [Dreissena polymorpha]|nr:uncharacterized protein LOC127870016 [Dreissena polymorpha]
MEGTPVHWLMIYSAIALTVLAFILAVILIVYCHTNRNRMSFKPPNNVDVVERENRTIHFIEHQQRMRLIGPRNSDITEIEELAIECHTSELATNISLPKGRKHSTNNGYPVSALNDSVSNASNDQTFLKKRVNTSTCTSQTLETNLLKSAAVEPSMFEMEPVINDTHSYVGTSNRQRFTSEEYDTGVDVMEARLLVKVHKDDNRAEDSSL